MKKIKVSEFYLASIYFFIAGIISFIISVLLREAMNAQYFHFDENGVWINALFSLINLLITTVFSIFLIKFINSRYVIDNKKRFSLIAISYLVLFLLSFFLASVIEKFLIKGEVDLKNGYIDIIHLCTLFFVYYYFSSKYDPTLENNPPALVIKKGNLFLNLFVSTILPVTFFILTFLALASDVNEKLDKKKISELESKKNRNIETIRKKDYSEMSEEEKRFYVHPIAPKLECENGWKEYKNDALGIEFCHPEEWGEPNPSFNNVTKLSTLHNRAINYQNKIGLSFSYELHSGVHIALYNETFTGRDEDAFINDGVLIEDVDSYNNPGMDIVNLKKHGDICEYKIGYDYQRNSQGINEYLSLKNIYSNCEKEIRTVLTEESEKDKDEPDWLYSYNLKLLSFIKLSNNYYDNVFIARYITSIHQINEKMENIDDFFDRKKTSHYGGKEVLVKDRGQVEKEKQEFATFVKSIKVFSPPQKEKKEFVEIPTEDKNIATIKKFYWFLENEKFNEAYALLADKKDQDLNQFTETYKNIYLALPETFKSIGDNKYDFRLKYQEHNVIDGAQDFHIVMKVEDEKIETIFSEEILEEVILNENLRAFIGKQDDQTYVMLEKNGKKIEIQSNNIIDAESKYGIYGSTFMNLSFYENNNFLKYDDIGWEWRSLGIYDIKRNKKRKLPGPEFGAGFSKNDNYFYICTYGDIYIYALPDFKEKIDLLDLIGISGYDYYEKRSGDYSCQYSQEENKLILNIINDSLSASDSKWEYFFDTNKIERAN